MKYGGTSALNQTVPSVFAAFRVMTAMRWRFISRTTVVGQGFSRYFDNGFVLGRDADGFSVDLVRRLLGDEKADHMQIFCLNHGLLETNPIVDLFNRICEKLQKNVVENRHGIYTTNDEIICKKKEQADAIADLFEDMGVDVMHTSQEEDGWHVYFD